MKKLLSLAVLGLVLSGCVKGFEGQEPEPTPDPTPSTPEVTDEEIKEHAESILGITIPDNQDWISTESGTVTINVTSAVTKVSVMAMVAQTDEEGETYNSMTILNQAEIKDQSSVTLNYDVPKKNEGLYVAFYTAKGCYYKKVEGNSVTFDQVAKTRAVTRTVSAPSGTFAIGKIESSFAAERGWIPDEKLYMLADDDYNRMKITAEPYSADYKALVDDLVFAYLPQTKTKNNLDQIIAAGYTDDDAYRITTGDAGPILVSPIYKKDGSPSYGREVYNSDFYYYYFNPSEMPSTTEEQVAFLQSLPKYKLLPFNIYYGPDEDDVLEKRATFALLYFGDSKTPAIGTEGTFKFPKGYKIGFMVRAKTDHKENGKPRKQGELYFDGRLNVDINGYSETNFKSSVDNKYWKLPLNSPRATWLRVNDRVLMCWESGTDADFNDILLEVEGSVEPIYTSHEFEYNTYTFCFEDTQKGDYDLNDVVIKAKRINETTVEYSIVACGAYDELCVRNVNAGVITDNVEVHSLFGVGAKQFVNTESGAGKLNAITAQKTVSKSFSFLDTENQPFIYDLTTKLAVKLSTKGQDPHGIMIPFDFKYPAEKVRINDAYKEFNNWGSNPILSTNWYTKPVEEKVYLK